MRIIVLGQNITPNKHMTKNKKNSAFFCAVFGLAFLLGAAYSLFNTVIFLRSSTYVRGTVIELVRSETKRRPRDRTRPQIFYSPVVQFVSQNGVKIEFKSPVGSNPPLFSVGQEVEVLYHLQNPQNAKINEWYSLWSLSLCLSILGSTFFSLGSGMIIVRQVKIFKAARSTC